VLLHELLGNLLDNALRFTPEGGHVTVRVVARGARAVLGVEDSGPGIPAEERERIFDRFYQIPGRESPGCGLGLAIAREIAALHQAQMAVQAPAGGSGTLFSVEFPPSSS
jgi:two-component system sensor histidine kinase TctE